jgi:hypothetical protein
MSSKLQTGKAKLDKYLMKKEKEMEKIYADIESIKSIWGNEHNGLGYENRNNANIPTAIINLYKAHSSPNANANTNMAINRNAGQS